MSDARDLTEAEQKEAGEAMLRAALSALGKFTDEASEQGIPARVVRALVGAANARNDAAKRFGVNTWRIHAEPNEVVATAFWVVSEDVDLDPSEINPRSLAGGRYLGLARGLCAAELLTRALDTFEDEEAIGFSERGAEVLADLEPDA